MGRRSFDVVDLMELFVHWEAGRSQVQIGESLDLDRKTVRKYLAPALAEGLVPGGHADRTWGARVREYIRPTALILDDFGLREHTAAQADDLYELISDRAVNHRPLILTSNRRPLDWYPLFPNPVVAESLLDRLINTSHQVLMDSPSYRPRKRPGRPDSTPPPAAG